MRLENITKHQRIAAGLHQRATQTEDPEYAAHCQREGAHHSAIALAGLIAWAVTAGAPETIVHAVEEDWEWTAPRPKVTLRCRCGWERTLTYQYGADYERVRRMGAAHISMMLRTTAGEERPGLRTLGPKPNAKGVDGYVSGRRGVGRVQKQPAWTQEEVDREDKFRKKHGLNALGTNKKKTVTQKVLRMHSGNNKRPVTLPRVAFLDGEEK